MNLIKTSLLSGISSIIKIINGFVIVKIIAVYVGPSGLAFIGQFQNFISVMVSFATGALNSGVVKYTAEYREDEIEKQKLWSTAIKISLSATFLTSLFIILFHNYLSNLFFKTSNYGSIFIIFAITLVFFVLNSLLLAILNGQKEIKKLILISIVSSFVGLLLTGLLSYFFGLYGALLSYTTGQAIVFFVTLVFVFKSNWFQVKFFLAKFDKGYLRKLGGYTAMAITAALVAPISSMIIRTYIGDTISWEDAGYWDGIWKISAAYLMFVTTTLSIYYLPRLSEIKDSNELRNEIFQGYKIIMPLITMIALSIYLFRDIIISILFTNDFRPMSELFLFQMIGDVLKIASWLLAYLMIAKAMTKLFIITEILFALSFIVLSIIFIKFNGTIGVTIAFAVNYFFYLIVMIYIFRSTLIKPYD